MSIFKFLPFNRKRRASNNAIAFGAYKDEDNDWKSTGDASNFLIRHEQSNESLNFYTGKNSAEGSVIDWKRIFKLNKDAFCIPHYGRVLKIIELNAAAAAYTISPLIDNNAVLYCFSQDKIKIPDSSTFPIGFTFIACKSDDASATSIVPEGDVKIYGKTPFTVGDAFKEWTSSSTSLPIILQYSPVYIRKVSGKHWVISGSIVLD